MKRILFLATLFLAIGFISCDNFNQGGNTQEEIEATQYDSGNKGNTHRTARKARHKAEREVKKTQHQKEKKTKKAMRKFGRKAKKTARKIGEGTKKVMRNIGNAIKKTVDKI